MTPRLLSLDTFRGLTVAAMVLVNNPGTWQAVYAPLRHAEWHGWTPTDLVFPFFLFIVGVAIPVALGERAADRAVIARIVRRAAVIFALGLVLNGFPDFELTTIRIPGVLQRIAVCYLAAAILFLTTGWRTQAVVAALLLLGYWAALVLGGDLSQEGSLAASIDRTVLGPHLWRAGRVYDPEGILSTASAVATVLFGVLAGHWLRAGCTPRRTSAGLLAAGIAAVVVGGLWSLWLPINKALWTSSYAVLTAGMALVALAACYELIEARGYRRWAYPFAVFGVNALLLFFLSTLVARELTLSRIDGATVHAVLYERLFAPWAEPMNASLAFAGAYLGVWWLAMWGVDRAGVRLRI